MMTDSHNKPRLVIIVGFMGAGKTTVARELARQLHCRAIDLDELITERERRSPAEIIEEKGEDEFRRIEAEALRQVLIERSTDAETCVIALGGGAWMLQTNRDLINQHRGFSIWLDAPFELCWERIQASGGRRPLARDEHQARILHAERRPQYAFAEVQLEVARNKNTEDICEAIAEGLRIRSDSRELNIDNS